MPTYSKADRELHDVVLEAMDRWHSRLVDSDVTVDVLLAYGTRDKNDDIVSPAITDRGVQCRAKIKITSLRDRALGVADAVMLIDGDHIHEWSTPELDALIDHELTHLELATDKDGNLKRDDLDRPCLVMRLHDWEFGWFDEVARRHGDKSGEIQQARRLIESSGEVYQMYLPGLEPA